MAFYLFVAEREREREREREIEREIYSGKFSPAAHNKHITSRTALMLETRPRCEHILVIGPFNALLWAVTPGRV